MNKIVEKFECLGGLCTKLLIKFKTIANYIKFKKKFQ